MGISVFCLPDETFIIDIDTIFINPGSLKPYLCLQLTNN